MISFYRYTKQYKEEWSARGDLARDMIADREFPKRSASYEEMLSYLERIGACSDAISVFTRVYGEYEVENARGEKPEKRFMEGYLGRKLNELEFTRLYEEWDSINPRRPLGEFLNGVWV